MMYRRMTISHDSATPATSATSATPATQPTSVTSVTTYMTLMVSGLMACSLLTVSACRDESDPPPRFNRNLATDASARPLMPTQLIGSDKALLNGTAQVEPLAEIDVPPSEDPKVVVREFLTQYLRAQSPTVDVDALLAGMEARTSDFDALVAIVEDDSLSPEEVNTQLTAAVEHMMEQAAGDADHDADGNAHHDASGGEDEAGK